MRAQKQWMNRQETINRCHRFDGQWMKSIKSDKNKRLNEIFPFISSKIWISFYFIWFFRFVNWMSVIVEFLLAFLVCVSKTKQRNEVINLIFLFCSTLWPLKANEKRKQNRSDIWNTDLRISDETEQEWKKTNEIFLFQERFFVFPNTFSFLCFCSTMLDFIYNFFAQNC